MDSHTKQDEDNVDGFAIFSYDKDKSGISINGDNAMERDICKSKRSFQATSLNELNSEKVDIAAAANSMKPWNIYTVV